MLDENIQRRASNIDSLSALPMSTIQIDRPNNLIQIVFDLHRPIRKRRPIHTTAAEHTVELGLISRVISHRGRRILELMSSKNANHTLARFNHSLVAQHSSP